MSYGYSTLLASLTSSNKTPRNTNGRPSDGRPGYCAFSEKKYFLKSLKEAVERKD
jgi:hypothetical protein